MSSSNNKSQTTIDLNKIFNTNDTTEIKQMQTEFESNGWCFVSLPKQLIVNSDLIEQLTQFFESDNKNTWYSKYSPVYGYSKVNHKEGIKLLTGSYLQEFANKGLIPNTLLEPLNYLSQMLDAVTKRLIEVLDQHSVFQQHPSLSNLIKRARLPLKNEHFGMLDIVSYFNDKSGFQPPQNGESTEEVNCVPHYDPGLLSISVLSTHEGLQLKKMINDEWIDGPLESNIGVIWLGEKASRITKNRLKAGIHRVIYPRESKRRLTVWYEICTTQQLKDISDKKTNEIMAGGMVTFNNLPGAAPIPVLRNERRLDFLMRFEQSHGLTMTKAPPPRYILPKHGISFPTDYSNTNDRGAESSVKQSRLRPRTNLSSKSQFSESKISKRSRRNTPKIFPKKKNIHLPHAKPHEEDSATPTN
ncbi:unnamed protein product [Adineta ricciae]|uniref:Isopenicillin N synthase-like Fe(2+) 2OG dioxygenase domain-containing protein n=1 Tax=Adineta ricciae TaxID=249248 RepID=A0A814Y1T3_ADIRI|nr:unnamed protein product [Adineta ricciae]CAF1377603.1 unnamed protein product [Adineta ricciae]